MTAAATKTVDELTDEAIKKRIAAIDRLKVTRAKHIDDLEAEVIGLDRERVTLVQAQIARLRAQLPQVESDDKNEA